MLEQKYRKTSFSCVFYVTQSSNEKYTFRTWLLRLGLIGDEFKTARTHLLKNLDGNIAWKDPAQAEAQKERLAARRKEQANQARDNEENTVPENDVSEDEHFDHSVNSGILSS